MTSIRTAFVLVAGAALLAACSQPSGNTQTAAAASGAASAAAATTGPDTTITEADMPHPRAGLWQVTSTLNGGDMHTATHCYKGEPLEMKDKRVPGCTGWQFKRTFLGAYVVDAACATPAATSQFHAEVHGDFTGGNYTYDGRAHIQMGQRTMDFASHVDAHWIGPC